MLVMNLYNKKKLYFFKLIINAIWYRIFCRMNWSTQNGMTSIYIKLKTPNEEYTIKYISNYISSERNVVEEK